MATINRLLPVVPVVLILSACAATTEPTYAPVFAEEITLGHGDVVEPPQVLERPTPSYPSHLRGRGIEGRVVARGIVGRDGRLQDIEVLSADDPLLIEPLLDSLRQWRFQPATVNDEPVAVYYTVTERLVIH